MTRLKEPPTRFGLNRPTNPQIEKLQRRIENKESEVQRSRLEGRQRLRRQLRRQLKTLKKEKLILEANYYFEGGSRLEVFQHVVECLLHERPSSILKCRKRLQNTYIHIFDFISGKYDLKYSSRKELKARCEKIGYFPRDRAKEENLDILLKFLSR